MAIIKTNKTQEDVAKSLSFKKSGLDETEEEEVVETTEELEEEVVDDEEEETSDEEEEQEEVNEDDEDGPDWKKLWEEEREEKKKLLESKEKKEETPPEPPKEVNFVSIENFSDEDFENMTSSKESFVKTLNELGNKVRTNVMSEMMDSIPGMVSSISKFQVELDSLNRRFYEENPDLAPIKKYVGAIADEIIKKEGIVDLDDYGEMLKGLPAIVRKELKLNPPKKEEKKTPKGPKVDSQRKTKADLDKTLSPLQKDIEKSLSFMRGK